MNKDTAEQLAKMAALEAVKEFNKSQRKTKRAKVFQNAKTLMENYNRICQSVREGVAELSDMDEGEEFENFTQEDIFIHSIMKSKLRSVVMIAHIDKCMMLLEEEEIQRGTPEKYIAFKCFYLDEMTYDSLMDVYGYGERTARRWITELTNLLGVYLFGADAIMLD